MIGIFDSGYGGLTILREVAKQLPQYSYIYLGDNAHAPYGQKSQEEILGYTKQGVEELFRRGCILVVLGCNTASAGALRILQKTWLADTWPDRKLLGIVVPTLEQITNTKERIMVGVLATQATVESGTYEVEIHKRNPNITVVQYACNSLAGLIESEGVSSERVRDEAVRCVQQLLPKAQTRLDAVLLGCTHYELIADVIASALPEGTKLFHQPSIVAESLQDYLVRHPEIESHIDSSGKRTYLTTGDPEIVTTHSKMFMQEPVVFESI